MFELREYQEENANKLVQILHKLKIAYFSAECRTGKTLTALRVCEIMKSKKVLFVTKKKAIGSIQSDFQLGGFKYDLNVVNYESLHKIEKIDFDIVIADESHVCGAFPKMSKRTKQLKEIIHKNKCFLLMLSGTPNAESMSMLYHQFALSPFSPFDEKSFYKFAHKYVFIQLKKIGGMDIRDYSQANEELIREKTKDYFLSFTQKQAGFTTEVIEKVLKVPMKPITYQLIKRLKKDKVIEGKEHIILADTGAKLMSKTHQLSSGTIKFDDGSAKTIDDSKALFIKDYFKGQKIAIFYIFKQEYELLKETFGDNITDDLNEFNTSKKSFAVQIQSGKEGINLSKAESLVMFNIAFSSSSYFQSKERLSTKDRSENRLFWIFSDKGIESKIYDVVMKKSDFTLKYFNQWLK